MVGGVLTMSGLERERAFLVRQTIEGRLSQREASERLGIGVRQLKRLVHAWRAEGDAGLVSRQRGRASHRRMADDLRTRISGLLREKYADFGATLAAEKLCELDHIKVSAETVRRLQIDLGLWRPKKRRAKRVFQLRQRRPRFGELVQIDGSPHDWFEGRGPRCTLIVFIDDATSRLTALHCAPVESGKAYLAALREQIPVHGRPLAFYSDRHGIFRVNAKDAQSGDGKTEFGRVVDRLGITLINALTPQAKGRVERANQTYNFGFGCRFNRRSLRPGFVTFVTRARYILEFGLSLVSPTKRDTPHSRHESHAGGFWSSMRPILARISALRSRSLTVRCGRSD
jgi:transposase